MPQAKASADETPRVESLNELNRASVPAHGHEDEHDDDAKSDHEHGDGHEHGHIEPFDLVRIAATAIVAALVWFRVWEPLPQVSLIGIAGVLFGGWPIFREAFENLRERRMTMELSMTIALLAALGIGEFFTALIITAFVLAAEVLEGLTVGRGRRAIGDLLDLLPRFAWIVKDGDAPEEVPVGDLRPGDRVLIRPGTRIPVDGRVLSGNSSVEEAAITGESLPQDKVPGSRVYAGTLNRPAPSKSLLKTLAGTQPSGGSSKPLRRRSKREPHSATRGSPRRLPGILRLDQCPADVGHYPQLAFDDFGHHRRGSMWNCRRNSLGDIGSNWPRGPSRSHHQGRHLPGATCKDRYRVAR